ncbi:DUF839 domain-containing protein [Bacillus sonorensis]|nr:DUF839 domain-containing protein [Bacillus sonorensis]
MRRQDQSKGDTFGFNNDYTLYFPMDNKKGRGLLWVNHEYVSDLFVFGRTIETELHSGTDQYPAVQPGRLCHRSVSRQQRLENGPFFNIRPPCHGTDADRFNRARQRQCGRRRGGDGARDICQLLRRTYIMEYGLNV